MGPWGAVPFLGLAPVDGVDPFAAADVPPPEIPVCGVAVVPAMAALWLGEEPPPGWQQIPLPQQVSPESQYFPLPSLQQTVSLGAQTASVAQYFA